MVADQPCVMNRIVPVEALNAASKENYAMGVLEGREAMLLFNKLTRRTEENSIEYLI